MTREAASARSAGIATTLSAIGVFAPGMSAATGRSANGSGSTTGADGRDRRTSAAPRDHPPEIAVARDLQARLGRHQQLLPRYEADHLSPGRRDADCRDHL